MASPQRSLSELSEQDRRVVEGWLAAFKQDWDERRLGTQVRRLPAEGPLREAALAEMVKIDLKQQWQKGRRAKVEAYLKVFPELGTSETVRIDLVLAEYEARRQFGAPASLEEFARRFPNQAEDLGRHLASAPGTVAGGTRDTRGPAPEDWPAQATRETCGQHSSTHPSARPSGAASLPEQFGRYRIVRELGRGGMGSVHLAHDTQLDRPVALKVPHFGSADGPTVLQRFQREARAAATINHPNICPVHDVGEHEGVHFVTMAYIEGKPLSELLKGGKVLPPRQVAALVRKLALALHEAHTKGVVHRDLKPSNVMVNKRNEPVIMDFGLARRAQDARLTGTGAMLGTPAYMPPEQVQGDVEAMGPGCDIYSLGVMFYELLTGRLPFEGPVTAVLGQILTQEPPPPRALRPDLDPELEAICLKAMAKKIGDRFRSMAEFAAALTRYLKKGEGGAGKPAADPPVAQVAGEAIPVAQVAPTGASTAGGEGLATELLAKLVDRLEVSTTPAGQPPSGTHWWVPLLIACVLLLGGGVLFYLVTQQKTPEVQVQTTNTVVVQLPGLKEMSDPTVVVFILDGKQIRKEELTEPISLAIGEHELKIRRKNDQEEIRKFTIGEDKTVKFEKPLVAQAGGDGDAQGGKRPPAVEVPGQDKLPGRASWDLAPLQEYFALLKASHNAEENSIAWLAEAKRGFDYVSSVVKLRVRFHDADGARVYENSLRFSPDSGVKKGDKVRISLGLPDEAKLRQTKRVLMLEPGLEEFPAGEWPAVRQEDPARLPGHASWDLAPLQEHLTLLKVSHHAEENRVSWLAETKRGFDYVSSVVKLRVRFYDADGARVYENSLRFSPDFGVLKGERLRISLGLPDEATFRRVKKVTLERP